MLTRPLSGLMSLIRFSTRVRSERLDRPAKGPTSPIWLPETLSLSRLVRFSKGLRSLMWLRDRSSTSIFVSPPQGVHVADLVIAQIESIQIGKALYSVEIGYEVIFEVDVELGGHCHQGQSLESSDLIILQ